MLGGRGQGKERREKKRRKSCTIYNGDERIGVERAFVRCIYIHIVSLDPYVSDS